ncbi:NAD(P)H-binding protein [Shewanella intestini]|uniref:NAD(P)H-binding protein n=1 Tax=Shewanella intestini TaxID=2017544 RepID=A0ABS5I544_9GAMM|nr:MULTISPECIES: NAD(P)H-binding protein [Shewanella]MBR9729148.1 NAD(P)H-binding protein [Shewanella intestini]
MSKKTVVMLGATGAVGNHCALVLSEHPEVKKLTLLGRRIASNIQADIVNQHIIDIFNPDSYRHLLTGHNTAVCTLGVGSPTQVSQQAFIKIDRDAVLAFASACKEAGVLEFALLSSIGANAKSKNYYMRTKGELEQGLQALGFTRLSLFHPSMILTPENRYGLSQAIALRVCKLINPFFFGSASRFKGIPVAILGQAIALHVTKPYQAQCNESTQILHWQDMMDLHQ